VWLFATAAAKELEGVEPCPICFSVVAAGNHCIPRSKCANCGKAFHAECVAKWFKRGSGGSDRACPMCRQSFGGSTSRRSAMAAENAEEEAGW
jgi:hypothetical protein